MKRILFVVSHEGSGSTALCKTLEQNERIVWNRRELIYNHPQMLSELVSIPHKINNAAAIWMDELLNNYNFTHKGIYSMCKFIYVVRSPSDTFGATVYKHAETFHKVRAYLYRMRRICEMAKKTPNACLLTWEDMFTGRAFPMIQDYLDLKDDLILNQEFFNYKKSKLSNYDLYQEAESSYERYYYYLNNLPLRRFRL